MQIPDQNPREDAMAGDGQLQLQTLMAKLPSTTNYAIIQLDAAHARVQIKIVDNTGADLAGTNKVDIHLADLGSTDVAMFRSLGVCDETGAAKTAKFLMTAPV